MSEWQDGSVTLELYLMDDTRGRRAVYLSRDGERDTSHLHGSQIGGAWVPRALVGLEATGQFKTVGIGRFEKVRATMPRRIAVEKGLLVERQGEGLFDGL